MMSYTHIYIAQLQDSRHIYMLTFIHINYDIITIFILKNIYKSKIYFILMKISANSQIYRFLKFYRDIYPKNKINKDKSINCLFGGVYT